MVDERVDDVLKLQVRIIQLVHAERRSYYWVDSLVLVRMCLECRKFKFYADERSPM